MLEKLSIEHLKSGISINTHVGCPLRCKYCVLNGVSDYPQVPTLVKNPNDLVNVLYDNQSYYVVDKTPIYVNNRTDPFLPQVIDFTYQVLAALKERNCLSPILLISKMAPTSEITAFCESLNLIFIYTYANLPDMDFNSNLEITKRNLAEIIKYVPLKNRFHYYRPIIPNRNDCYEAFTSAMHEVGQYFRATIIGGIRVNKSNIGNIDLETFDINHKFLEESFNEVISRAMEVSDYTIFRHTSCLVSYFLARNNYLNYFEKENHCYRERCKNFHNCNQVKSLADTEFIEKTIRQKTDAKFCIDKNFVIFLEPVSQEVIACIRNAFGISVTAESVLLCPSEEQMVKEV